MHAQKGLGDIYNFGLGVQKDYVKAAQWYRLSAEQGFPDAQLSLAGLYYLGQGLPKDYAQTLNWTRKAAEQDFVMAQKTLGDMYESGYVTKQDFNQAAYWFRKAADHGLAEAQDRLGYYYAQGIGMPLDYAEAELLWKKSASQGNKNAKSQLEHWHSKISEGICNNFNQRNEISNARDASDLQSLPLKAGLWKLQQNVTIGSAIESESEKSSCSFELAKCVKESRQLPTGKFWPEVEEMDKASCNSTTVSETEYLRNQQFQCNIGALNVHYGLISEKASDEKYIVSLKTTMKYVALVGNFSPPTEIQVKVTANFSGACAP